MRCLATYSAATTVLALLNLPAWAAAKDTVSFNRDIRPILSDTCFHCHGFDEKSREGGLRLDLRDEALKAGESGTLAIVPGKPEESEIIARIFAKDEGDLMPPEKAHKKLTAEQKDLFRRWVEQGAKYEEHWAYVPLAKPVPPAVVDAQKSVRNPLDQFILAELEKHQTAPSAEASKRDLLRRLSLDLTGLPPTPEEMQNFLNDSSADAYDQQVTRLLKSPHYGERMAVWWLDVARFTDTVGFHGDQNQRIFPYRDYVINAFNQNKSFKQFTVEQLAGDLLPNPTTEQLVATGFNRLNMMTREGGAQAKEYLAKYGAERARTVATTWLGSTFGCAECHDHKFDPISQRDFYSLQAYFADVKQWGVYSDYKYSPEPELVGYNNEYPFPPEIEVESAYMKRHAAKLRSEMLALANKSLEKTDEAAYLAWHREVHEFFVKHADGWAVAVPSAVTSLPPIPAKGKAPAKREPMNISVIDDDGRVLFMPGAADDSSIQLKPGAGWVSSLKVELLPMKNRGNSIFRSGEGEMNLKFSLSVTSAKSGKAEKVSIHFANANLKKARYDNGAEVIGVTDVWITKKEAANQAHTATLLLQKPLKLEADEELTVTIAGNQAAAVRVSTSPLAFEPINSCESVSALKEAFGQASPDLNTREISREAYLLGTGVDEAALQSYRGLYAQWREQRGGKTWSMITQSVSNPLTVRVLPRGNWMDESGAIAPPSTPGFLPVALNRKAAVADARQTRMDLAEWICSDANPLTARAVSNRLWKEFFGNGLSIVVDDLGAQGEPPSHPQLLDWLASEFRDSGWDLQHLIRLMVSSHTYRQSSNLRAELKDLDPNNRLLASQNPRRLEAEFVRDNALFIAGMLNVDDIGGPSVKPYQPAGYYENLQFPSRDYVADVDDRQWRRGLYMHWQRTFLHPMLANFDAPSREECTAFRPQSNTPQQALTLLNDPTFVEAARVFAERLLHLNATGDGQRLDSAYHLALGRAPNDQEKGGLLALLNQQREHYRMNLEEAGALIKKGIKPAAAALDPAELAAWTSLARVMLNLHETITRY